MQKIIKIKDTLYECLGIMNVDRSNEKGTEYSINYLKDEFNFECIMHGLSEIASGFLPFD